MSSSLPAKRTGKLPAALWRRHKAEIKQLYIQDGVLLDKVMSVLKKEHGFAPTKAQYKRQFARWGFRKNRNFKVEDSSEDEGDSDEAAHHTSDTLTGAFQSTHECMPGEWNVAEPECEATAEQNSTNFTNEVFMIEKPHHETESISDCCTSFGPEFNSQEHLFLIAQDPAPPAGLLSAADRTRKMLSNSVHPAEVEYADQFVNLLKDRDTYKPDATIPPPEFWSQEQMEGLRGLRGEY